MLQQPVFTEILKNIITRTISKLLFLFTKRPPKVSQQYNFFTVLDGKFHTLQQFIVHCIKVTTVYKIEFFKYSLTLRYIVCTLRSHKPCNVLKK
jgi:hypothetical protein